MGLAFGNAAGAGAMGLPAPGGAPAAGQLTNPLAQMLAQLGPNYQPGDTRWGLPGDRLLRFTPQQGNAGMAGGSLGKGGPPPPAGGGSGIQTNPNGSSTMPGLNPLGIGDGSGTTINWQNLVSATNPPPPDPSGAPANNAAMEKLKSTPIAPGSVGAENAARAALVQVRQANPGPGASKAAKDAWYAQLVAATQAYNDASRATGASPGATPNSPFAPGQVGSL